MDINYYLSREQVELALAGSAVTPAAGAAHTELAGHYRRLIDQHRTTPSKVALAARRGLAV